MPINGTQNLNIQKITQDKKVRGKALKNALAKAMDKLPSDVVVKPKKK